MQQQQPPSRSPSPSLSTMTETALTYDEVSMHRSRHFVMALQELKNLRPQLYSAAEYCESSYLYSEQKQAVLENLKDYSVKALVNAVDHLGTVACKLNDLLVQQTSEIASTEVRVASLAQRFRTCQEYTDREGLKQQSLVKTYPRHHKHYSFPDAGDTEMPKSAVPDITKHEHPDLPRELIKKTEGSTAGLSSVEIVQAVEPGKAQAVADGPQNGDAGTLSWHMAAESRTASVQPMPKQASNGTHASSPTGREAYLRDSPKVGQSPTAGKPSSSTPRHNKASPLEESRSLSVLMSTDGDRPHKELRPIPSRSKSMFMSLLGKKKSFKVSKSNL